jgi:hypothetical protein
MASFKQSALFLREPLVFAAVLDADIRVLLINATVAKVNIHILDGAVG